MIKKITDLQTSAVNTWCPGCSNFAVLTAYKQAILNLIKDGYKPANFVDVSGIGCSSKIIDYVNINSFSALHGRPVASAQGIKLGNPELTVTVSAGDGGTYNEGISHLIHAAKRNTNLTVLVHDNRTFALTTGQFTGTSPEGFVGASSPEGSVEKPFNPLALMLNSGATFIARSYSFKPKHLQQMIEAAIRHKGFSFVEILQPCITFYNTTQVYNQHTYELDPKQKLSRAEAEEKINEWDYGGENDENTKIPLGIFHQEKKPTFEEEIGLVRK